MLDNPHLQRQIRIERTYFGGDVSYADIRQCEDNPPIACPTGDGLAYWKPTVGTYICPQCRNMRYSAGDWSGPRPRYSTKYRGD